MQTPQVIFQDISIERVTRENGLPSHQVHHFLVDNGKLWMATPNGLAIFDGEELVILDQKDGLLTHGLRSLTKDANTILVCSDRGVNRVDIMDLKSVDHIATAEIGLGWCHTVVKISHDDYLLACANGLRRWKSSDSSIAKLGAALDSEIIINMIGFERGSILIQANHSGLWLYNNDKLQQFASHAILECGDIKHIYQEESIAWLISNSHAVQLDKDFHIIDCIKLPEGLERARVIFQINADNILVADEFQLISITKVDDEWHSSRVLQCDILVNDIKRDEYGNVWAATEFSGLIKISALNHYIESYRSLRNNSILSLQASYPSAVKETHLLIGGAGNSFYIPISQPEKGQEILALKNITCWDLQQFSENKFFAATDKGLIQLDDIKQSDATVFFDEQVGDGRCISNFQEGLVYGSVSGLFLFKAESKTFEPILDQASHSLGYVYSLFKLSNEYLLVATLGRGLWRYHVASGKLEKQFQSINATNVYAVELDEHDRLLIAADNKIWMIEEETPHLLTQVNESIAAWCCRWYSPHQILLGTSQGLKIFDLNSRKFTFIVDNFPRHKYWEFTTARSLFAETPDNYWCGLNEGLQHIKLRQLEDVIPEPIPEIKTIESNSEYQLLHGQLSVQEGNWAIQIRVGCTWLWQEYSLNYRYRLIGLIPDWRKIDGAHIELTTLPVGEYILEVATFSNLAQSFKSHQLLMISVEAKGWFSHSAMVVSNRLRNTFSKFRKLRSLLNSKSNYNEMENLVEQRTLELSTANQELIHLNEALENLSIRDQLTGMYNRRFFYKQLDNEIKRAMRDKLPLSILMFDIDFFKKYNDNYGHLDGDICLQRISQLLSTKFQRSGDLIARFGGEEFIAILHNSSSVNSRTLAQQCIDAVAQLAIPHAFSDCAEHITISIGVCSQVPSNQVGKNSWIETRQMMIKQADEALYESKKLGRNRVTEYGE